MGAGGLGLDRALEVSRVRDVEFFSLHMIAVLVWVSALMIMGIPNGGWVL